MGVTTVAGADATVPPNTTFESATSTTGEVPGVRPGYIDGSNVFHALGDASGFPVQGSTTLSGLTAGTASSPVNVTATTSAVDLIAANANRKSWRIQNLSPAVLYLRLGGTASATACIVALPQYYSWGQSIMDGDLWLGAINGVWASAAGGIACGGELS